MTETSFIDSVKRYFDYLESKYNFRIIFAKNSDVRPRTDGMVKYASDTTLILIDSETGQFKHN
jgi:hypothetical protein